MKELLNGEFPHSHSLLIRVLEKGLEGLSVRWDTVRPEVIAHQDTGFFKFLPNPG